MKILKEIVSLIKASITSDEKENGGLLGMKDEVICKFLFDKGADCSNEYVPDVILFNQVLKEWASNGIEFAGIIHSHPNDCRFLSFNDEKAIMEIYNATESNGVLYFPLITFCRGDKHITAYKCENGVVSTDDVVII